MTYTPKEHEFIFRPTPIGVGYTCEFCNEGEMVFDKDSKDNYDATKNLYKHKCTNCNSNMLLPKVYPYIEWSKGGN